MAAGAFQFGRWSGSSYDGETVQTIDILGLDTDGAQEVAAILRARVRMGR